MAEKKNAHLRKTFKNGEYVVYPAHGVGVVTGIEKQEIAGAELEMFVIHFEADKLTLRVPVMKVNEVGMRRLSDKVLAKKSLALLKGKPRIKRTMWSRRAQEYEAKINSGDLLLLAEVVRDLYRGEDQPEQSYSERQLYEAALRAYGTRNRGRTQKLAKRGRRAFGRSALEKRQGSAQSCRRGGCQGSCKRSQRRR